MTFPAAVLDLRNWYLTLPTGSKGSPTTIQQPDLATYSNPLYFRATSDGGVAFAAPVNGVTTSGSHYSRSELREMFGSAHASWSSSDGKTHTMIIDQAATRLPNPRTDGGNAALVGGQIHGASNDISVFRVEAGKVWVTKGNNTHYALADGNYKLGTRFQAAFVAAGGKISAYYNGKLVTTFSAKFSGAYFKAGAYTQANCGNSAPCDATNYGENIVYGLTVAHGAAVPVPTPGPVPVPVPIPAPGGGSPGGQSIGDPYFPQDGNTGYRVDNYTLDLSYTPGADLLSGTATITATTTQDLSSFSFDFGLATSGVTVNGVPAAFKTGPGKLIVTPSDPIVNGQRMSVAVTYSGVPSKVRTAEGQVWFNTPDGAGSVAEPHYAATWYPCNDHPSNKATWDVSVSVPAGTTAITNGELVSSDQVGGRTVWKWHMSKPTATYGTFLAVGKFDFRNTTSANGRPFIRAYDNRLSSTEKSNAVKDIERTPEVIAWEAGLFGPYPFDSEGGVAQNAGSQNDAEEFQSRPCYSDVFKSDDLTDIVHENAHQWFGCAVTPKTWRDIWLNEGFARYSEWLWDEHTGKKPAAASADANYNSYKSGDSFWKIKPGDPGAKNLLDDAVYERGAMTLATLRATVGDAVFFQILQHRVSEHLYGNESTAEFIALANRISGKDLTGLFDTWLFTAGRPPHVPSTGG